MPRAKPKPKADPKKVAVRARRRRAARSLRERHKSLREMNVIAFSALEILVGRGNASPAKEAWAIAQEYVEEHQRRLAEIESPARVLTLVKKRA